MATTPSAFLPRREGRRIFLLRGGIVLRASLLTVLIVAVLPVARPSDAFQQQRCRYDHQQQYTTNRNTKTNAHGCSNNSNSNDAFQRYTHKNYWLPFEKHRGGLLASGLAQNRRRLFPSSTTRLRGGGGENGGSGPDENQASSSSRSPTPPTTKTTPTTNDDDDKAVLKRERFRRRGMAVALGLSNFSVMGAKCALPSVLSLLMSPDRGMTFLTATTSSGPLSSTSALSPQNQFAQLLGFSTLSVALGKLLLGPVIDKLGGIRALQATLLLLLSLLATITVTQRFSVFAACWVLVDFVFSSCWAACISSIQQSFPPTEWGRQIGYLATGARLGNAASFSLFAAILFALEDRMVQPWRVIFLVSTVVQVVPLCFLFYFGGMTLDANRSVVAASVNNDNKSNNDGSKRTKQEERQKSVAAAPPAKAPRIRDSLSILRREAATPEFWLHLVSRSCLMVFASFLLFVPTLMNQVYGCSNAVAAQVASAYSLGCLLSVSLGSRLYAALPTTKLQITAVASLLALASGASLLQLGHAMRITTLSWTLSTLSMFVWGFAFSLPFYLPPSLYALSRGGRDCSASIADCFDFFGFSLLAWFNRYVASIGQHKNPSAWVGCFRITTACSLVAMVSQSFAIWLEKRKKEDRPGDAGTVAATAAAA